MAVQFAEATFAGAGAASIYVREKRQRLEARFAGAGAASINVREKRQRLQATFAGNGIFSANVQARFDLRATFAGSGSLSAVDSIISMQVSILSTTSLQAIASNPLVNLMSDPKSRLVFAVEIGILPIN